MISFLIAGEVLLVHPGPRGQHHSEEQRAHWRARWSEGGGSILVIFLSALLGSIGAAFARGKLGISMIALRKIVGKEAAQCIGRVSSLLSRRF